MKQDQDEYSKAFMADPADDAGDENMPGDDAAEATGDEPASGVVLAESEGDAVSPEAEDAEAMTPEEVQKEKSWEGRLRAKEAELAAREAKLAEVAAPTKEVPALADGGKVEDEVVDVDGAEVEPAEEVAADGDEEMAEEPSGEEPQTDGASIVESIRADAIALAKDPEKLAGVLESMVADYGREYVIGMVAANVPMVEAMAEPYVGDVEGRIEQVISGINQAWTDRHFEAIRDAHEDFEEIADSEEFKAWAASLPEEEQAKVQETIERGSAGRIVALLTKYKDGKKPKEQTPDDIWAEDAAAGVKSSAPVNLPTRAPMSDEDEYKSAFNNM